MRQRSNRFRAIPAIMWGLTAILILSTVEARPTLGECEWVTLSNAPHAGRVDGMFFIDSETGWCVNSSGQIWHTDDGGDTWVKQLQSTKYLRSIAFLDPLRGWAGALDAPSKLYGTSDGGVTWRSIGRLPAGTPARICGMAVVDTSTLIACGSYDGTPAYIQTYDAGATWIAHDLSGQISTLVDAWFLDDQNGFLAGGADGAYPNDAKSVILRTQDGGATWTRRFTGSTAAEWCWKIFFLTDRIGFVSVESPESAKVLKTVDGGFNWQEILVPDNFDIQGVGFANGNLGWAGGWEFMSESTDGGNSWTRVDDWGPLFNRFVRISPTVAYASGATVYKLSCTPEPAPKPITLFESPLALRCHPNPFNASTTISFDVPTASPVRVRIYDALGKHVCDLLDTELPAGARSVEWNGRDAAGTAVASGVYLYRVDAAGTADSRSMVLVK